MLPCVPLLDDLSAHYARQIDANERDRFSGCAHFDVCRHARGNLLPLHELIVDFKRVLVVDEERAFAESLALAIEFQAGFRSAGCALTFPAATQRLREATVDVALVTLSANLT